MKIEQFANYLNERYHANPLDEKECEDLMEEGERFIAGFVFPDAGLNYLLLTANDLTLLSDKQRNLVRSKAVSPYAGLKAIIYENESGTHLRVANGIGSVLCRIFEAAKAMA